MLYEVITLPNVGTGRRSRKRRQFQLTFERDDFSAGKKLLDSTVMPGKLTAGAGDHPASQRGILKTLGKVSYNFV